MFYYGGGSCGCSCQSPCWNQSNFWPTCGGWGWNNNQSGSNYAIILVLFILLVIVIGARFTR